LCGAGKDLEQIEIGDMVTVSNHGNLFPFAIVKIKQFGQDSKNQMGRFT
jgi:hypothetical protein